MVVTKLAPVLGIFRMDSIHTASSLADYMPHCLYICSILIQFPGPGLIITWMALDRDSVKRFMVYVAACNIKNTFLIVEPKPWHNFYRKDWRDILRQFLPAGEK